MKREKKIKGERKVRKGYIPYIAGKVISVPCFAQSKGIPGVHRFVASSAEHKRVISITQSYSMQYVT